MNSTAPRRARAALVPAALCLAALATLGFPGCPENVTGPGGGRVSSGLTLSSCWPNDDGHYWQYATTSRQLEPEPFTELPPDAEVPEITLGLVRSLLADDVVTWGGAVSNYEFRLEFDGDMTTGSGVTAQRLAESFPVPPIELAPAGASFEGRLLDRIAAARPDLRARLGRQGPSAAGGRIGWSYAPYFIHGYAWIKGPSWIGTYGDVDTLLAWKFLESNVRPGNTFRHRLVPSLAEDVWLIAGVERTVTVNVPGVGRSANAIEVIYAIDYGAAASVDAMGNVTGRYRPFDYGKVVYAPGIGPVSDLERRLAFLGEGVTHGFQELELHVKDTGVAVPGVLAAARRRW